MPPWSLRVFEMDFLSRVYLLCLSICARVGVGIYMCACTYVYVCISLCVYTYGYVCMSVFVFVCLCIGA